MGGGATALRPGSSDRIQAMILVAQSPPTVGVNPRRETATDESERARP